MIESLVKKYNGIFLKSAYIAPEYTIEEVIADLNKYGIKVDPEKEEGASILGNKAFTWNISEEGTSIMFYCDIMDASEYKEAYEEITEFEDDDEDEE